MAIYGTSENFEIFALGIDPGRDKTGFAFINLDGELILSGIIKSCELENFLHEIFQQDIKKIFTYRLEGLSDEKSLTKFNLAFIALGDGTHSKEFFNQIKKIIAQENFNAPEIILIDERNSTLEARKIYFKIHRPKFLARLLPESLLTPKRAIDDLAAYIIALRALKNYAGVNENLKNNLN